MPPVRTKCKAAFHKHNDFVTNLSDELLKQKTKVETWANKTVHNFEKLKAQHTQTMSVLNGKFQKFLS